MAPVFPIGIGATARPRHFSAMRAQPRTQIARDNARIQCLKSWGLKIWGLKGLDLKSCGRGHEEILLPPASARPRIAARGANL